MPVEFNSKEFIRDLKQDVENAANASLKESAAELQRMFDRVQRTYAKKPVASIKSSLKAECNRADLSVSDQELTEWAKAIHDGTRIVIELAPGKLRL